MTMGMVDVARLAAWAPTLLSTTIDLALNQVRDHLWHPSVIAVGVSPLDHQIAAPGVVRLP